jgi:SAM-dependent methyltransferase
MLRHAQSLAEELTRARGLNAGSLVVEVASNDGYLLQYYKQAGVPVLGIEPATNIARAAQEGRGIPTLNEFFGAELAGRLRDAGRRADVIHANNVLAHVADLNGFVRGIATLLADDGVAVIEVPYVKDMIDKLEFDTIYHEHLCYFSVRALAELFRRHGLHLNDLERIPIHGGSLRLFVQHRRAPSARLEALLAEERAQGLDRPEAFRAFAARVEAVGAELRALLARLRAAGKRVAAYGAAAKGTILLNHFRIGPEELLWVADRNPHKQGLFVPGVKLPIVGPERIAADAPDYLLILPWNHRAEIIRQQAAFAQQGGQFIIPIPKPHIVGG